LKTTPPSKYKKFFIIPIFFVASCLFSSCIKVNDPYYPAEIIPQEITKICQKEYSLDVKVNIFEDTLWLYIPLQRFVDQTGEVDQDFINTLNHVMLSISRVIMSTELPPQFYVIVASDTKDVGADYILVGYILDVKRYLYNFISREEFSKRQVVNYGLNPEALGDIKGEHVKFRNIMLNAFILAQIEQRIALRFEEDNLLSKFKIQEIKTIPQDNNIKFILDIKGTDNFKYDVDFANIALKTIAYVFFAYDFKEFETVTIVDSYSGKTNIYNRKALEDFR
jgi:hypothetical protein